MEEKKYKRLSELIFEVKNLLNENFSSDSWVTAILSDFKGANQNGHFYFKLIEKGGTENIVETKAMIFRGKTFLIEHFKTQTGIDFENGIEILVKVKVDLHEKFGFGLIINAIEPNYTINKIEDEKRKTILRLEKEKIIKIIDGRFYSNNKALELPLVIQRIAIITSAETEGDKDFRKKLLNNKDKYSFFFPYREQLFAPMQGKNAPLVIIEKLKFIRDKKNEIDAVVIVRGGGDNSNFDCFNDYELCKEVANYPIPLITGIGHEVNQSIIDLVAHTSAITPTEAAEIIIATSKAFENEILRLRDKLIENVEEILEDEEAEMINFQDTLYNLNPLNVLKRGYAIVTYNGKVLSTAKSIKRGTQIKTYLKSNIIDSQVTEINKRNENKFDI